MVRLWLNKITEMNKEKNFLVVVMMDKMKLLNLEIIMKMKLYPNAPHMAKSRQSKMALGLSARYLKSVQK